MLKKLILIIAVLGLLFCPAGVGQAQNWTIKIALKAELLTIDVVNQTWDLPLADWSYEDPTKQVKLSVDVNSELIINLFVKTVVDPGKDLYKGPLKEGEIVKEEWSPIPGTSAMITVTLTSGGVSLFTLQNPLQADSFQELVENIINFVWVISLVVTPLMILIAGFLFLTAGGRPNQITAAKKMIFWTILGFIIITLAEGIIAMLKGILGG